MNPSPLSDRATSQPVTSLYSLAARLTWALGGPAALLVTVIGIARSRDGWLTWLELVYAGVVGVMMMCRWIEYRSGNATELTGEATTPRDFRRYMIGLPILAAAIWISAKLCAVVFG